MHHYNCVFYTNMNNVNCKRRVEYIKFLYNNIIRYDIVKTSKSWKCINMEHYKSPKSTKQRQKTLHPIYYSKLTVILSSDDTTPSILLLSIFGTITSSWTISLVGTSNGNILLVRSAVIVKFFCCLFPVITQ